MSWKTAMGRDIVNLAQKADDCMRPPNDPPKRAQEPVARWDCVCFCRQIQTIAYLVIPRCLELFPSHDIMMSSSYDCESMPCTPGCSHPKSPWHATTRYLVQLLRWVHVPMADWPITLAPFSMVAYYYVLLSPIVNHGPFSYITVIFTVDSLPCLFSTI